MYSRAGTGNSHLLSEIMERKLDAFDDYVMKVISGKVPTVPDFICALCGGDGKMMASQSMLAGMVNVSAYCSDCGAGGEYCSIPEWEGWKNLRNTA
jgi:hypothetical protein